jgi:hypothetical protein
MGDLMGTDYITRSVGRIEATIPEVGTAVIAAGIPGATVTDTDAGHDDHQRRHDAPHPRSAYADWELDIDRLNGGQFQFEVDNAINTGNFEGELQDAGCSRRATSSPVGGMRRALNTSPWRIRILDVAS